MLLYHRTTEAAAQSILRGGFRDGVEYYMTTREWSGVWLSNMPLDCNRGPKATSCCSLELPEQLIADYEWIEEGKGHREWLIPAQLVNEKCAGLCIVDEDQ